MNKHKFRHVINENVRGVKRAYNLSWVFTRVVFESDTDYHMAMSGHFPLPVITLYVDYSSRKFGKKAVIGLLAHEIAHYFTDDERRADEKALEAGFQENLIAFHTAHDEMYEAFEEHEGMTLREIWDWRPK